MKGAWVTGKARGSLDPARVENALGALVGAWPSDLPDLRGLIEGFPVGEGALLHLLSVSTVAAERLMADPGALVWLSDPAVCARRWGVSRTRLEARAMAGGAGAGRDLEFGMLRRFRGRQMLRIALRDVADLAGVEETTGELSDLAALALEEVYAGCLAELTGRWGEPGTGFAVIGMGKLGGRELNFSSDIDVIFVYGDEGSLNPAFTRGQFFSRLAERLVATFASAHPAGPLFRIDLRLRPEGASGPLVRSRESMEHYYASMGETWERMALMKARGVCGDPEVAYELLQYLQSYIYPRLVAPEVVHEIAAIKGRIEREVVGPDALHRNVKLGRGGIREIEFVVQTFQLLQGARQPFLQEASTLKALRALGEYRLLPDRGAERLTEAYLFLRRVEHRLQIEAERQTHTLPPDEAALRRLGRSLGFRGAEDFLEALRARMETARRAFEDTVSSTPVDRPAREPIPDVFEDPQRAGETLDRLGEEASGLHHSTRARKIFANLRPLLLAELGRAADPDGALSRLANFVGAYGIRGLLYESLVRHPRLLELVIRLFDSSAFLSEVVVRRPELIEEVAREGRLGECCDAGRFLEGLRAKEEDLPDLDWVRVYRRAEMLRIALRDILGFAPLEEVQAEHAALAEACLLFCIDRLGVGGELTVLALGKFGGRELGYGADLDVVFVGEESAAGNRLVQEMGRPSDEGSLFKIDLRLRPEGENGVLVCPLDAYREYFRGRAQFWEAQSLTRARAVGGPQAEGAMAVAREAWARHGAGPGLFRSVREMLERVRRERAGAEDHAQFKTGTGGLMEFEFLVQALQMRHGVWETNTLEALGALVVAGHIDGGIAGRIAGGYRFLRRTENALRRFQGESVSALPRGDRDRARLARRLGYGDASEFLEAYGGARATIHEHFEGIFREREAG